jgi:hypothetical protein
MLVTKKPQRWPGLHRVEMRILGIDYILWFRTFICPCIPLVFMDFLDLVWFSRIWFSNGAFIGKLVFHRSWFHFVFINIGYTV